MSTNTKQQTGKCSICNAPIYLEGTKFKRTCYHSDQDDIKNRLGLL